MTSLAHFVRGLRDLLQTIVELAIAAFDHGLLQMTLGEITRDILIGQRRGQAARGRDAGITGFARGFLRRRWRNADAADRAPTKAGNQTHTKTTNATQDSHSSEEGSNEAASKEQAPVRPRIDAPCSKMTPADTVPVPAGGFKT
jgi:hypothetical protein